MTQFYLPNNSQSILLVGKNGSGKTRAAVWHLSKRDLANSTWVVINHKREEMINSIPHAKFMDLQERPRENGIYIYQPRPEIDDAAVTELLWWVYEAENIGLYIDEGYMISPRDAALNSIYTQGRSKHIPVITLSQRPMRISRFAISEATFYQVFILNDRRDRKTIEEFMPVSLDRIMTPQIVEEGQPARRILKPYHSVYYDTREDEAIIMHPVPPDAVILSEIELKLRPLSIPQKENSPIRFI